MITLAELGWKVGDLGRFQMEGNKHPRFEVLGENPGGAIIWYAGDARPQVVPLSTFKDQCVNHWVIDVVPTIPQWIKPNVIFNLDDRAARVLQAEVTVQYSRTLQVVDLRGKNLKVRHIRLDHVSCLLEIERQLVFIPLKAVIEYGYAVRTSLDVLLSDEFEEPDEVEDLLKNL
jgi:hypothetical protein